MEITAILKKARNKIRYDFLKRKVGNSLNSFPEPHITELSDEQRSDLISVCLKDIKSYYDNIETKAASRSLNPAGTP